MSGQLTGYNCLRIKANNLGDFTWSAGAGGFALLAGDNAEVICENLKLDKGANASAILAAAHQPSVFDFINCEFGDAGSLGTHTQADHGGSTMNFGVYKVSGGAGTHLQMGGACSGSQAGGTTITIVNTPVITTWFSLIGSGCNHVMGSAVTYSGAVAAGCIKYLVAFNAQLALAGNIPPGSIAGSVTAGGQVV
jgi:hypothetical protein